MRKYFKFKDSNILHPQDEQIPLQPVLDSSDGSAQNTTETFEHEDGSRSFKIGDASTPRLTIEFTYEPNVIKNQKYTLLTFLPTVLYQQFKFFLNLYFLLVASSQLIKALQIGTDL
jgi:hypothetical protein